MKYGVLMPSLLTAVFAVALLCSCSPATHTTRFAEYPPRPADHEIKIYRTTLPDRPYEEIGIVTSRKRNRFVSMDAVVESLKKEARKMGGDAIISVSEASEARGFVEGTSILIRNPVLSGTVIRFLDEEE